MISAVTRQIAWNRLINIVDEASTLLVRASFSSVVRESYDFACVICDQQGNLMAQSTQSIPSFIGTLPRTIRSVLAAMGPVRLNEGDVVITNDPWLGTGHLPDINVIKPIYADGRLVAIAGSVAHSPDVGGRLRSPDARSIFEEGLRIPILKLMEAGRPNEDVLQLLRANVRVPNEVIGDLAAQVSAVVAIEQQIQFLVKRTGYQEFGEILDSIIVHSEGIMRDAIRSVPPGEYEAEIQTDDVDRAPITLRARVVLGESNISIDYAGSSPQVRRALNVVLNYTFAFTAYALKCVLCPQIPNNEGTNRLITVTAPEGSILNARFPAPVGARAIIGHYIPPLVFKALASAIPSAIIGQPGSPLWCVNLTGELERGRQFVLLSFLNGGMGASAHADGASAVSFPSNVSNTPVELLEILSPVRVDYKELRPDSGGAGRTRGGLGQRTAYVNINPNPIEVSFLADRTSVPAEGVLGGGAGATGYATIDGVSIDVRDRHYLAPGGLLEVGTPGGGGYGEQADRPADWAARDLSYGYATVRGGTDTVLDVLEHSGKVARS